jgi:hypothetical protein
MPCAVAFGSSAEEFCRGAAARPRAAIAQTAVTAKENLARFCLEDIRYLHAAFSALFNHILNTSGSRGRKSMVRLRTGAVCQVESRSLRFVTKPRVAASHTRVGESE